MGKLMILLYFILSVFPADATTNDMCSHLQRKLFGPKATNFVLY